MYHLEWFNVDDPKAAKQFFKERFLPYFRSRGFDIWIFVTQHCLGPAQFTLVTGMGDKWGSIDGWAELAEGEQEGRDLMDEYRRLRHYGGGAVVENLDVL